MSLTVANITFDCDDPRRVAAFWAAAMDLEADPGGNEFFVSAGVGKVEVTPNWFFIKVPEPKSVKNRVHLDLQADDVAAEVARLVSLGATHVADKAEFGHEWSVMNDVEGNEFCVSGPHA
jgi:predicted enzyme related to lactoylglutathione lyase